jgi:cell division protein FtsA
MNARQENLITVLDAGSSKSLRAGGGAAGWRAALSRPRRRGVAGHAQGADLRIWGRRRRRSIQGSADGEKSTKARGSIETAVVGIGGTHVRGVNSPRRHLHGQPDARDYARRGAVCRSTVRAPWRFLPIARCCTCCRSSSSSMTRAGIHDPMGMVGNRLEVNLHLSTCSGSAAQSVVTCANRAGLEVADTMYEGIAAAEAVLSADERELGVCVVDIGASSTELVVFFEGSVAHTAVLPIGGDHFTNDLAVGLHVSVDEAEQLKRMYGNCVVTSIPQLNEIEIGSDLAMGGQSARMVRQRFLAEILEPRARELLTMLRDNLRTGGVLEAMGAGCVFTGGGAHLVGLLDNAESLLRVPARIGYPVPLSRMPSELAKPEFAAAIGMLLYTHRTQVRRANEEQGLRAKLKAIFAGSY